MRVLFIAYVDADFVSSGSGVRPTKMLCAFREEGHDVIVLSGNQVHKKRTDRIRNIKNEIARKKPDICYIESPTYPIMLYSDRELIKIIHDMGIPIGYFYRDFYRKFPELFPRRKSLDGRIKDIALDFLQWRTDCVLRYCNIVYVPSEEARRLLNYRDVRPLPPAGENRLIPNRKPNHTAIYVGGITEHYGGKFLLDVFNELHKRQDDYRFILVCRKEEWDQFNNPYGRPEWLEIHHTSGDDGLAPLYRRAAIATTGKSDNVYNEFAVSVKTFEYLSYGLPQVVVKSKAIERIITSEKIGIAIEQDVCSFADAIEGILDNPSCYQEFQNNIKKSLLNRNLWVHRVRQIVSDLHEN